MKILAIAGSTFRELIRGRTVWVVLVYPFLLLALAVPGGYVAVGQERKILVDVGLSLLTLLGISLGTIWGTGLAGGGIDRQSLGFLLSKPIDRWHLVVARYGALAAAGGMTISLMGLALSACHLILPILPWIDRGDVWSGAGRDGWLLRLWIVIGLVFLEVLIVTALAMLLRELTGPALAVMLTFLLAMIGRSASEMIQLAETVSSPITSWFLRVLYYLIPNLASLNYLAEAGYESDIPLDLVGGHLLYALFTVVVILLLTVIVFERREVD